MIVSTGKVCQGVYSPVSRWDFVETETLVLYSCSPFSEGCSSPIVVSQDLQEMDFGA